MKLILWLALGARAEAGWWQSMCDKLIADAPIYVLADEYPMTEVTTLDLIARYRSLGGQQMWRRTRSVELAHLGYVLRQRADHRAEIEDAIHDYGDWEQWPGSKPKGVRE